MCSSVAFVRQQRRNSTGQVTLMTSRPWIATLGAHAPCGTGVFGHRTSLIATPDGSRLPGFGTFLSRRLWTTRGSSRSACTRGARARSSAPLAGGGHPPWRRARGAGRVRTSAARAPTRRCESGRLHATQRACPQYRLSRERLAVRADTTLEQFRTFISPQAHGGSHETPDIWKAHRTTGRSLACGDCSGAPGLAVFFQSRPAMELV